MKQLLKDLAKYIQAENKLETDKKTFYERGGEDFSVWYWDEEQNLALLRTEVEHKLEEVITNRVEQILRTIDWNNEK